MKHKILLLTLFSIFVMASFGQTDTSARTYKMVINFASFASGVPSSQPLENYIKKFRKANKIKAIAADRIGPYGREGEYKLAFTLKELTRKQRTLFIKRVKKVVAGMKENGKATLVENETITSNEMPERATIVVQKF